jgi:hypothetical protein
MSARIDSVLETAIPPSGMKEEAWRALQASVRETLAGIGSKSPELALETVQKADATLVLGLVGAVEDAVRRRRKAATDPGEIQTLETALSRLAAARSALIAGNLAVAHAAYEEARTALMDLNLASFRGGAAQAAGAPSLAGVGTPASGAPVVAMPNTTVVPFLDPAAVASKWQWQNRLVFITTMIVGVLVGLGALYAGKPTWGGLTDIVVALLWGIGLYQASGAAAQGFGGVRTSLTS